MAITPEDLMNAYEERKAQGLDPGFFLQPWSQSLQSIVVNNNHNNRDVYQQKRLAALHAQEQYDKVYGGGLSPPDDDGEEDDDDNNGGLNERKRMNQENSDMLSEIFEMHNKGDGVPMEMSSPVVSK
jgi:hypothetical protein